MEGWETISKSQRDKETSLEKRMLTAKIFYYSRFLEPITLEEYESWLADRNKDDDSDHKENSVADVQKRNTDTVAQGESLKSEEQDLVSRINFVASTESEKVNKTESQEVSSGDSISCADSSVNYAASQVENPKYPASFVEVMQRVQAGLDIPGVEELHIEATNKPVTESSAARVNKPWDP